jgi:thiol:disulfide interchange protein
MRFFKHFIYLLSICLFFSAKTIAQDSDIVQWKAVAEKISEGNYKVTFNGAIKKGWHVYSTADKSGDVTGITIFKDDSTLTLKDYQLFSKAISIDDKALSKNLPVIFDSVSLSQVVSIAGKVPSSFELSVNYEVGDNESFFGESDTLKIATGEKLVASATNRILIPTINIDKPLTNCRTSSSTNGEKVASKGLFSIFSLGFLGGLIALLTPCVFPMIPLTVSFFTKKAQSKKKGITNAFLYGFFIFLIYVLVTVPFHIFDKLNSDILNDISTNVYLNIIFFIVFVVFALSFFGLYEITLPSSITNKTDSKANAGTITGIFFMALTLTIVSFSCTGPLAGSLLAGAASGTGGAMRLSFGMAGFGVALGLPFALFALFPGMLNSLPKSGGWLTTVKVVLGFLELGFAFKFLSNADQVMHWGLLKREIFIGIWIIIGVLLSLYLWGILKFKNDAPIKKLSIVRIILAVACTAFTVYLFPGVTNTKYANLSLISGFPPPLDYSIYTKQPNKKVSTNENCILDLNCTHDYEEAVKMAKEQHKTILLDFTGYACVNCRRMEENVWSNESVHKLLQEKFIVVSLYVDDKKMLPVENRFTYTYKNGATRDIKTVGDKWSVFETENFKSNSQPWYAMLNENEELLTFPCGYTPNVEEYLKWLQCGVDYKP